MDKGESEVEILADSVKEIDFIVSVGNKTIWLTSRAYSDLEDGNGNGNISSIEGACSVIISLTEEFKFDYSEF